MTNFEFIMKLEGIMNGITDKNPENGLPYTPEYKLLCIFSELRKLHTELMEEGFKKPEV